MSDKFSFPTEEVELPSKGLLYPKDSPLATGKVEMKYMTAREEDILTNANFIKDGTVIDRLLQSLIVTDIDYDSLLIGDKNALFLAARVLGYGKDYDTTYKGREYTVDLSKIEAKPFDEELLKKGGNSFEYTLPTSRTNITFKLLTHGDEKKIDQEIKGLQKINPDASPISSTRLKYMLLSVDGETDRNQIKNFVDNYFLARDSRAFRKYVESVEPDVDLVFYPEDGPEGGVPIPLGVNFLWPDARVS